MRIQSLLRTLRLAIVGAAAALTLTAAPAHAEFMGGGHVSAVRGCERAGFPVGTQMVRARYAAVETDRVNSIVLYFAVGGANTYTIAGGAMTPSNTYRRATGSSLWGASYTMSPAPSIRVVEREIVVPTARFSSSVVDANTRMVRLVLTIRNFNGVSGCEANVVLNLARWN